MMPFVVGAIRSGTTLLRLMLDSHSQIAMAAETAFPEDIFLAAHTESGDQIGRRVIATPKWPDLGVDRDDYLARCAKRCGAGALRLLWELYRERQGKRLVGDKSPGYVRYLKSIERVLPGIRVIHLIRDGRDCFASQRHARFSLRSNAVRSPQQQAEEWCSAVGAGRRDGPALAAYLEVRYEDLILDTERVLQRVCGFLGVDYEPEMNDYHTRAAVRLLELGDRVVEGGRRQSGAVRREAFALTGSPPDDTRVGRWRETLLPKEVAAYESVAGPLLAECGYEPASVILARRNEAASLAHAQRATVAMSRRDYVEAARCAVRAYRTDPQSHVRMLSLMSLAEWVQDFPVQWRMEVACDTALEERFRGRLPCWGGEPLDAEHRLFVWRSHRHLGADVRYAAMLSNLGTMEAHCTVAVDHRLRAMVKRRFPAIDVVTGDAEPPPHTAYHASWELLGHYVLPSEAAMPAEPWLAADPDRVAALTRRRRWRRLRPRVAIAWHSTNTDKHLPPLESWRHVLAVPGVEFVSVQQGIDPRSIAEWHGLGRRVRVAPIDLHGDLDGLAALLRSCDLVVAISASQVHLAGALGVPTWVVMRELPQLSWPLGSVKTAWYPRTQCHWVRSDDSWERVMRHVAAELRRFFI